MELVCAHISSHFKDVENPAALWPFAFLVYLDPNLYLGENLYFLFYPYIDPLKPQLWQ